MITTGYLGIDVGSISTKFVVVDAGGEVLFAAYDRSDGNPIQSIQAGLRNTEQALRGAVRIAGVCTTGSGRTLVAAVVGADIIKNEISAHARSTIRLYPEVQTIFEIGGQDSKVTLIRDGAVVDFAMNTVCAAGTGSFLDSQARRLSISIEELSKKATLSSSPTSIAGRCTVFAESDMIHKQQTGYRQEDILLGLCHAMVRNYLNNVCRGKDIRPPIVFEGGVSENRGICRAFRQVLKTEIVVPPHHTVMGAYGAALIAAEAGIRDTAFRGFDIHSHHIETTSFECEGCPNCCEVLEVLDHNAVVQRAGGRCGKWEREPLTRSGRRQDRGSPGRSPLRTSAGPGTDLLQARASCCQTGQPGPKRESGETGDR